MPLEPTSTTIAQRSSALRSARSAGTARSGRRPALLRNTDRSDTTSCLTASSSATGSAAGSSKRFNCIRARADTAGALTPTRSRSFSAAAMTAQAERTEYGRPALLRSWIRRSERSSTAHWEPIRSADSEPSAMRWWIRGTLTPSRSAACATLTAPMCTTPRRVSRIVEACSGLPKRAQSEPDAPFSRLALTSPITSPQARVALHKVRNALHMRSHREDADGPERDRDPLRSTARVSRR